MPLDVNDWGIVGHDWAVRRLKHAIASGQLAQSHLFVGPPAVGKATLAQATARALLGHDDRTRGLADQRRHPDLIWIEPQSEGEPIKVEQIRDLLHALTLMPVESRHRVAVVDDAHLITDSGKNAILKTLEEPNPRVVIILVAPSVDTVLPTITSRCQVLSLRPAPIRAVEEALLARGVSPDRATLIARLSRGRVGWALCAAQDEALLQTREQRLQDLRALLGATRTQRFAFAEGLARAEKSHIAEVLDDWLLVWRDVTRMASGCARDAALINADHREWIARLAGAISVAQGAELMRAIGETQQHLRRNVNPRLALDVLLMKLPRLH